MSTYEEALAAKLAALQGDTSVQEEKPEPQPGSYEAALAAKSHITPETPRSTDTIEEESLYTNPDWIAASKRVGVAVANSADILTDVPGAEATDEEWATFGLNYMGQFHHNLTNMSVDAINVSTWEPEDAEAFGTLLQNYSRLPSVSWSGAGRFAKGVLTDASTYAGVGILARVLGAQTVGKEAVEYLVKQGVKRKTAEFITKAGATVSTSAIEGGTYTAAADALTQSAEMSSGLRDEYDVQQTLTSAGYGTAAGIVLPGAFYAAYRAGKAAHGAIKRKPSTPTQTETITPDLEDPNAAANTEAQRRTQIITGKEVDEVVDNPNAVLNEEVTPRVAENEFRDGVNEVNAQAGSNVYTGDIKPGGETITRYLADGTEIVEPMPKSVKNLSDLETTADVQALIHERTVAVTERLLKEDGFTDGVQTLEKAEAAAKAAVRKIKKDLGEDELTADNMLNRVMDESKGDIKVLRDIQARALVISDLMTEVAGKLTKMAKKDMNSFTAKEKAEFLQLKDVLDSLSVMDGLYSRQFSRNLGSRRVTRGAWNILDKLENTNKGSAFTDEQREFAALYDAVKTSHGNLASLRKKTKPTVLARVVSRLNGFRTEAMISGMSTQQAAGFGNILNLYLDPLLKRMAAGRIKDSSKAARMKAEAALQIQGYRMYAKEAWQAAKEAFRLGDSLTDPSGSRLEREMQGLNQETPPGFIAKLGKMKLFGDLMNGYDEMAKFLYTRSVAYARAHIKIAERHPDWSAEKIRKEANAYVRKMSDTETGRFRDKDIVKESRGITFTDDINDEVIGQVINRLANAGGGVGRLLAFPFVKAPLNMLSTGMKLVPGTARLAPRQRRILENFDAAKEQMELFQAGKLPDVEREVVEAAYNKAEYELARLKGMKALGNYLMVSASLYTASGNMTGNGPSDPQERRDWIKAGNKPLSIRIPGTGEWISYKALEPIATPLAIAADLTYALQNRQGQWDKATLDQVVIALNTLRTVITDNILSKSSLMGVEQFTAALNDPKAGEQYLKSLVTSFLPNAFRDAGNLMDDEIKRENGTLLNQIKSKLPVFMEQVGHKYDMFGRPMYNNVNPLYVFPAFQAADDPDPVMNVIADLKAKYDREGSLSEMPYNLGVSTQQLDFRAVFNDPKASSGQSVYSQFHKILGDVRIDGKSMYASVREYVKSPQFLKESYGNKGFRPLALKEIAGIMAEYRQEALYQLEEKSPGYRRIKREAMELEDNAWNFID